MPLLQLGENERIAIVVMAELSSGLIEHKHGVDEPNKYGCLEPLKHAKWARLCHTCYGDKKINFQECPTCQGRGTIKENVCPIKVIERCDEPETVYSLFSAANRYNDGKLGIEYLDTPCLIVDTASIINAVTSYKMEKDIADMEKKRKS